MNKHGGGNQTNINGLGFEDRTNLNEQLNMDGALYMEKHKLYKYLKDKGVDYSKYISKKLLPDGLIIVKDNVYVIEKKFQNGSGSVDEKIQTCDFKKKQYQKLFSSIGYRVHYWYLLNEWFKKDCYRDVFEYIESVGCRYFFEYEFDVNKEIENNQI